MANTIQLDLVLRYHLVFDRSIAIVYEVCLETYFSIIIAFHGMQLYKFTACM